MRSLATHLQPRSPSIQSYQRFFQHIAIKRDSSDRCWSRAD
ncbi:hypothetical protein [Spirulina sp. 06S082]|nr:hypothetical protein [Spirulina sp. 06S082]MEA5468593.1 hypothetical protein [Spirulina sp. 06S082]